MGRSFSFWQLLNMIYKSIKNFFKAAFAREENADDVKIVASEEFFEVGAEPQRDVAEVIFVEAQPDSSTQAVKSAILSQAAPVQRRRGRRFVRTVCFGALVVVEKLVVARCGSCS